MARKKGGPSRMDMRRQHEAAEARGDEEEDEAEEAAEEEPEEAEDEGDGDDDEKPKKKPAKKAAAKKPAAPKKKATTKRTRTPKEVRKRAVWVVFDNSSKRVDTFPFNQKKQAEELLAKKIEEKKATFYLNLVKDDFEE